MSPCPATSKCGEARPPPSACPMVPAPLAGCRMILSDFDRTPLTTYGRTDRSRSRFNRTRTEAVLVQILASYTPEKRLYRHLRRITILSTLCGSHSPTIGLCLCIFLGPKAYHHLLSHTPLPNMLKPRFWTTCIVHAWWHMWAQSISV